MRTEGAAGTAIVTGAVRGIGRRTAERLASDGSHIVAVDIEPAEATTAGIIEAGGRAEFVVADVSDEASVAALADHVRDHDVDVLVNNAGISCIVPAEHTTTQQWRRVIDVNLTGPFLLSREIGALMLARHSGAIINVASVAGLVAVADRAAYNASKHGLIGLTRTLAAEWGARGIRVNAVCPGWVKTEMDVADQAGGGYTDDDIVGRVPMARFASPDDVAAAVRFLADPLQSGFVNGHTLSVDGGWFADGSWEALRRRTQSRS